MGFEFVSILKGHPCLESLPAWGRCLSVFGVPPSCDAFPCLEFRLQAVPLCSVFGVPPRMRGGAFVPLTAKHANLEKTPQSTRTVARGIISSKEFRLESIIQRLNDGLSPSPTFLIFNFESLILRNR